MLQKLRGNSQGFTLIELMIVIAIIGILAAIAIPNFIAYRNKAFCSRAESDGNAVAAALADYFAVPTHTTYPTAITADTPNGLGLTLSGTGAGANSGSVVGPTNAITITITDGSARCPVEYRNSSSEWSKDASGGVFTKLMD